jgi:predicted ribosomally synthesized peptide with SipW-like signal peptide
MTEKDSDFDISRRKALAGLSTIGIASAGAGLGTTAYLNDTESFEGNSLTAGTLNLKVSAELVFTNTDASSVSVDITETDGDSGFFLSISDVKPGDRYIFQTDYEVTGNPSYLKVDTAEQNDNENGYEAAEPSSGPNEEDMNDSGGGGELDELLQTGIYSAGTDVGGGSLQTIPSDGDLSGSGSFGTNSIASSGISEMGATTTANASSVGDPATLNTVLNENLNPDGTYGDETSTPSGSPVLNGMVVQDGTGDPAVLATGTYRFAWDLNLPATVENVVQGDSVTFSIGGTVEQARNNSQPFS